MKDSWDSLRITWYIKCETVRILSLCKKIFDWPPFVHIQTYKQEVLLTLSVRKDSDLSTAVLYWIRLD